MTILKIELFWWLSLLWYLMLIDLCIYAWFLQVSTLIGVHDDHTTTLFPSSSFSTPTNTLEVSRLASSCHAMTLMPRYMYQYPLRLPGGTSLPQCSHYSWTFLGANFFDPEKGPRGEGTKLYMFAAVIEGQDTQAHIANTIHRGSMEILLGHY